MHAPPLSSVVGLWLWLSLAVAVGVHTLTRACQSHARPNVVFAIIIGAAHHESDREEIAGERMRR